MASSEDTEITLGTGKLLVLFFGLVGVCALFFALGYSLGRKSETSLVANVPASPQMSSNTGKAGGGTSTNPPAQSMTFYKAVEQKDANPQLSPPADSKTDTPAATEANPMTTTAPASTPAANPNDSPTALPTSGYLVQVAAVSKQEDAEALVDALKKKDYPAFVAPLVASDKLFRVQLGPFADVKEAEAMRTRLIADGYSPILKK